jgi:nucleoside-diphosphate-sugar epimerase
MLIRETVLVTGSRGYLGSRIAENLALLGFQVLGLDTLPLLRAGVEPGGYTYFRGDITRPETFPEEIKQVSLIVHCAALVHRRSRVLSRESYFKVNHSGTKNLLSALDPSRLRQIVFLSSVSVYGNINGGSAPDEQTRTSTIDYYGESKVAAEEEIITFSNRQGIPHTIFRLVPVYGKDFLLNIRKRIYLPGSMAFYRIGKGNNRISLVAVGNVIEAVCQSTQRSSRFDGIFNMTDRADYSINDIIGVVRKLDGHAYLPLLRIPKWLTSLLTAGMTRLAPRRGAYLGYQLRKVSEDAVYSGEKLFSAGFEPRWDLASELLENNISG